MRVSAEEQMTVQVADQQIPAQPELVPQTPVLAVQDAAVRIGDRKIWSDVNLDIYPGEFVAILGPNGAGKSTLIKALLGLVPLAHGSISVLGRSPKKGRSEVGYVPQRRNFGSEIRIRGRDVVQLGLDGNRWGLPIPWLRPRPADHESDKVQEVIEMVGAERYADRPIGELSGGEQQRLLIAQALVTHPCLLLLDEPLDGLDLHNQHEVSGVIARIAKRSGAAVLMVAHDVNPLLRHVDRLVYVANGRMAVGRPDEIIASETLSRLYGSPVEVLRTRDGRLVVVGQPEGVPCADYHAETSHHDD